MVKLVLLGTLAGLFGFAWGFLPLASYVAALLLVTITARHVNLTTRFLLPIALATMHFAWGWGFIVGFVRGAESTIDRSRVVS